ncbi:MAG: hypothetical protein SynsKO_01350 [Synoicihabitans sp.]
MADDPRPPDPLNKQAKIAAPRARVWRALTDPPELATWFGREARVDLRVGGAYEILFLMDNPPGLQGGEGNTINSFEPERWLDITWNAPPQFGPLRDVRTHVRFELNDTGTETTVHLTHDGWGTAPEWAAIRAYFDRAWDHVLTALNTHVSHP